MTPFFVVPASEEGKVGWLYTTETDVTGCIVSGSGNAFVNVPHRPVPTSGKGGRAGGVDEVGGGHDESEVARVCKRLHISRGDCVLG